MTQFIQLTPARQGMALAIAMGIMVVIASFILLSAATGVSTYTEVHRVGNQRGALSAVDAVLSRREARLSFMAKYGDANKMKSWSNYEGEPEVDENGATMQGKNYGEDIVGKYRVRWKIEPVIVRSIDGKQYIANPPPDIVGLPTPVPETAASNTQADNSNIFLYRMAAEAVLYANPDHPALENPTVEQAKKDLVSNNPILARAQGVRFVGAFNSPLFRWVIFYAQGGPKGDLELTHGGTLSIQGDVNSNGAIYIGGDTKAMSWAALSSGSTTTIGSATPAQNVKVTGVDGIFKLNKAAMYGAFNWMPYMTPNTSADLAWLATNAYSLNPDYQIGTGVGAEHRAYPLDSSIFYARPNSTLELSTKNYNLINPYRITDGSGLVTQDNTRTINGPTKILIGSNGASTLGTANDAREAFRLGSINGIQWKTASISTFNQKALTAETGARYIKLDKSLLGRPLETQQLAYVDNPATVIDESKREEYARPVFRDDGVSPGTTGEIREAVGYYMAKAMGATDGDDSAYAARSKEAGKEMRKWRLDVGAATPAATKGLIIRERFRPDFEIWGPSVPGAKVVPANNPQFKPYAYGKQYYPVSSAELVPVNFGRVTYNDQYTAAYHNIQIRPDLDVATVNAGVLSVVSTSSAHNNYGPSRDSLNSLYTDTPWTSSPFKMIQIGADPVPVNKFSSVRMRIDSFSGGDNARKWGLGIVPGRPNGVMAKASQVMLAASNANTTLTLDDVSGLEVGSILILSRTGEVVSVKSIDNSAQAVVVKRGCYSTSAQAVLVGDPVRFNGALPVVCRLAQPLTSLTATDLYVDDVSLLQVNDTLRLFQREIVRIVAIDQVAKKLTVKRTAGTSIDQAQNTESSIPAGTPLHWGERTPYLAMLHSDQPWQKRFFIERRERPSQFIESTVKNYWNGDANESVAPYSPKVVTALSADITALLPATGSGFALGAKVTVVQKIAKIESVDPRTPSDTEVALNPTIQTPITWSSEGTNYNISKYGVWGKTRVTANCCLAKWSMTATIKTGTTPTGLGFWDPTPGNNDGYGDFGKPLYLFRVNQTGNCGNWQIQGFQLGLGSDYYGLISNSGTQYFGTRAGTGTGVMYPVAPDLVTLPYTDVVSVRYEVNNNSTASTFAHARIKYGFYDNTASGAISVYNATLPPLNATIELPPLSGNHVSAYLIPSGAFAGRYLVPISPPDPVINPLPGLAPTWNDTGTGTPPLTPQSDYFAATQSNLNNASADLGFAVDRSYSSMDTNPAISRWGVWYPTPTPQYLPKSTWPTPPSSYSIRPDQWGNDNGVPNAAPPTSTSVANSLMEMNGSYITPHRGQLDDIKETGTVSERWVAMARVDANGMVSTNPADSKVQFYYYFGSSLPPTSLNDAGWKRVTDAGNVNPVRADLGNLVQAYPSAIPLASNTTPLIVGPFYTSGNCGATANLKFSKYKLTRIGDVDVDLTTASPNDQLNYTKYLKSQYQVFWGTTDITDKFFDYTIPSNTNGLLVGSRLASENWFFQTREFWSQSRWWNEEVQAPTSLSGVQAIDNSLQLAQGLGSSVTFGGSPVPVGLIEKDATGFVGGNAVVNNNNFTSTTNRQLWAKTTVLDLDLANIQYFLKTKGVELSDIPKFVTEFNGLIYVARTNRLPWVPDLNWTLNVTPSAMANFPLMTYGRGVILDPVNKCWLSNFNDYGAALGSTGFPDNYDNLSSSFVNGVFKSNPFDPWTCGPQIYKGNGGVIGTLNAYVDGNRPGGADAVSVGTPTVTSSSPWNATDGVNDDYAKLLVPNVPGYNNRICPRIKPQDFHHGVRINNGATLNVGYEQTPYEFGKCKLTICSPNQVYVRGNFNTTATSVLMKDGTTKSKVAPVAIMGDVITLQSNNFQDSDYQKEGLTVNNRQLLSGNILATRNGAWASTTTYNACFMTHNLPTTKDSLRFGEASSFVNTMLFMENWNYSTMNYTGSLVVMNSRRYSQAYLLEQPKVYGRTPFGWAGWNARSNSFATVPYNNITKPSAQSYDPTKLGTFASGSGFIDWVYNSSKIAGPASAGEMVPWDYPASLTGGRTVSTTYDGIPPVYYQPTRVMNFNADLKTQEGTPPFTPFGQTISGLGSWSRVIE